MITSNTGVNAHHVKRKKMNKMEYQSEKEQAFFQLLKEAALLKEAYYLADWDSQTGMPEKSANYRAEMSGYLNELIFAKENGAEMEDFVAYFDEHPDELSDFGKQVFTKVRHDFMRDRHIPAKEWAEYNRIVAKGHSVWVEARKQKDFTILEPLMTEMVDKLRSFIPLWQNDQAKTPYDVLLDQYEPGMTTEILDEVFTTLREGIMALRKEIADKGTAPRTDFLSRHVPKAQQEKFVRQTVSQIGYDFSKGRLDDTVHPFMQELNRDDARITTRWNEDDFKFAVFGVLHEAGHGTYEQNIDAKYDYTPFSGGVSMGIHESQSLFNELIIGSRRSFWHQVYPFFNECTEGTFDDIEEETFYRSLWETKPSFIRIEADSLTYPLHIIIRYEIEKMLFNGDLEVKDLPQVWNDKYEEYLGIRPADDLEGVLQDVHWPSGLFGYFPSYALGFMYAAQLYHAMNQEFNVEEAFEKGELLKPSEWLHEHIHRFGGSKTPSELIMDATGEALNPEYLLTFLKDLYFDIYQID